MRMLRILRVLAGVVRFARRMDDMHTWNIQIWIWAIWMAKQGQLEIALIDPREKVRNVTRYTRRTESQIENTDPGTPVNRAARAPPRHVAIGFGATNSLLD
ncbi:MAG TPA: hypothetical protein VH475_07230 [Tepidisphaeraceae bacterium]|jgi:hypothetical protein